MAGFTADELRGLAGDVVAIDPALARGLLAAIRKAVRGQRITTATSRLVMLAGELELAINDLEMAKQTGPAATRRKRRAARAADGGTA